MTSKERVAMAIAHEEPDRVPICATYTPEIEEKLRAKYHPEGDLGVALGNDMVKIASGLENSFYYKDTPEYLCPYGITWRNVKNETGHFTEIVKHPLQTEEDIYNYQMPKAADAQDVIEATRKAIAQYGKDKWIIGSCQCSVFEAAWYLRGLDTFMMDLAMEEDYADYLLDKVMQFPLEMGLKFIELGVDMVWLGDDIATQQNMMISPAMWRHYFKPRYAKMFEAFKKANPNIKLCYHSCGNLQAVVDDLIEIGLDVLNPIQPLAIDPVAFKKRFGDRITMYGALFAARMNSGQPSANVNLEFDAITAVILGGVSFSGGVGGMVGTVLGVFLIQSFNTGLTMVNIPTFWQYVARGGLLLFALTSDFIRKRNRERMLLEASKKNA